MIYLPGELTEVLFTVALVSASAAVPALVDWIWGGDHDG